MSRLWRISWIWIGCAAALTTALCLMGQTTVIVDRALALLGLFWCTLLIAILCCMRIPAARAFATTIQFLMLLMAASITCAFLQYPTAKLARPLIDAELAAFDRALYFDWPACFAWVLQHPMALSLLSTVYLSLGMQSVLVCSVAWRRPDRASVCLAANALTLTCCFVVFALWPAGGAFAYYQPAGIVSDYVEQFTAARSGLLTTLAFGQMKGIVQFPSLHAAAAMMFGYAYASLSRWIAVPALAFETVLAISAVPIGGHHLVDVLAGLAVAGVSLAIVHAAAKAWFRDQPRTALEDGIQHHGVSIPAMLPYKARRSLRPRDLPA